jgi:hypothetical protein
MMWMMAAGWAAEPTTCEGWEGDFASMSQRIGRHAASVLAGREVDPATLKFECNAARTECWTWTSDDWKIETSFTPGSGAASASASNSSGGASKTIEGMTYECDTDGHLRFLGGSVQ